MFMATFSRELISGNQPAYFTVQNNDFGMPRMSIKQIVIISKPKQTVNVSEKFNWRT